MNKNLAIICGIVVIAALGGFALFAKPQSPSSPSYETTSVAGQGDTMMQEKSNRYTPYTAPAFTAAAGKKRVLFFYANWCPTCRPVDAELTKNADTIPEDVVIFRVNYNDPDTDAAEKALASQYGITYQHTFVLVDASGAEIKKWNGGGLEEIVNNTK